MHPAVEMRMHFDTGYICVCHACSTGIQLLVENHRRSDTRYLCIYAAFTYSTGALSICVLVQKRKHHVCSGMVIYVLNMQRGETLLMASCHWHEL